MTRAWHGRVRIGYTKVTDAGLKELFGLKRLQSLDLNHTGVTGSGLERLRGELQGCQFEVHAGMRYRP